MKIKVVDNYSDFIELRETWERLLLRCDHTIFSTWEWLSTWWKHFGAGKRLVLLVAHENEKIIGIAPLMYSVQKMFGLRVGKITFVGAPHSDYNNFIVEEERQECVRLFIEYLEDYPEKWQCIELTDIPENAKSLATLNEISKNLKLDHICPYLHLPKSYDLFLNSLSRNMRSDLRRDLRRMEKDFKVEFADCSKIQAVADGMHWLFELHQKRWKSIGLSGAFSDPAFRSFHLDVANSFAQKGWLGLFLLKFSGNPVGVLYGFRYQSKFYVYLPGFDPKYSKYGIGNMLIAHAIGKCIEDGFEEFDFMRGDESYKARWKSVLRRNRRVIIPNDGFLSNAQNKFYGLYWHQGRKLKNLLKM